MNVDVRIAKGLRHICSICKAKRHEKFMKKTGRITRFNQEEYICNDDYCGRAWENQYHM